MTSNVLTNPEYWRDRAEEIQAMAYAAENRLRLRVFGATITYASPKF